MNINKIITYKNIQQENIEFVDAAIKDLFGFVE